MDILDNVETDTYTLTTGSGMINNHLGNHPLTFLSEKEQKTLDDKGYKGENRVEYLNSLKKGKFSIQQTKFDNGDFKEKFILTRTYLNK